MDFSLTEEQRTLQDTVRRFAESELIDVARKCEEKDESPPPEIVKKFANLGFLGINIPEDLGGAGMSHMDAVLVLEEVGRISAAVAFPIFESCFGPILAVAHFSPDESRRRIVQGFVRAK